MQLSYKSLSQRPLIGGLSILFLSGTLFPSCSSSEPKSSASSLPTQEQTSADSRGHYFLGVKGESREYVLQASTLEGDAPLPISANVAELESSDYLWTFSGNKAVGLVYQQASPGKGYGYTMSSEGKLEKLGNFIVSSRFTTFGVFDHYFVTSVSGQQVAGTGLEVAPTDGATFVIRDLNKGLSQVLERTIRTNIPELAGQGQVATFSGIVDAGNGEFLTSMIKSDYKQTGEGDGSSVGYVRELDSVWVVAFDKDLQVKRVYKDNRMSYSSGMFRSQMHSQIAKADDGTVYVFSSTVARGGRRSSLPAAALRIRPGAKEFDKDYYFNIEALSKGRRFRRVWHISGTKFLLEIYQNPGFVTAGDATSQYAIVDAEAQTYQLLSGAPLPSPSKIAYAGIPLSDGGKVYLPLTEYGHDATIYVVDIASGKISRGRSIKGATEIRAIGKL